MDGFLNGISKMSSLAAQKLHVKSALNPMLWLCGIVSVPCFGLACYFNSINELRVFLLCVASIPVLTTCLGFAFFAI
jgi:hypothetical protein